MDVGAWLRALGLEQYTQAFVENDIDAQTLRDLTANDLKDIGVTSVGHRKRLLAAIAELSTSAGDLETPATGMWGGERRQVTVLFADLAGFTRLSNELGAENAHGLLNRYFDAVDGVIKSYSGTIDKHMGDNVMAVFGAPVAHSNDPERAVRAACQIHMAMSEVSGEVDQPVEAHIGIASGQVVASGTGSEVHQEYTVTGAPVNLASRLQEMAGAGETLISDASYRAVSGIAKCSPLGSIEVKGFDQPVRVWRLEGLRAETAPEHRTLLVGRRREQSQFAALLTDCLETGTGQSILVRGEAGIGKTRLVEDVAARAQAMGFAHHRVLVLDFGVAKGRDAVRALVRSLLGVFEGSRKHERRAAAEAVIADDVLDHDYKVFLNDLLDLPQPVELRAVYDAMDNTARNRGKQEVVSKLIEQVSAEQPVLVTVEDIHWADPVTLSHLASIALTVPECPTVLVMTSRVEGDPLDQAWRGSLRGSPLVTIDLRPLREAEAMAMASGLVGAETAVLQNCVKRAEGNPLFLEQLLWTATESQDESLPGSIQALVLARADRLSSKHKEALQAASVFGQRFAIEPLRSLIDDPAYDCGALIDQFLIRVEGEDHLFAHALVQEGVYSSLLQARRRELHLRAAAYFANQDLVLHARHLDRAGDAGAARAYLNAARAQASAYRFLRALELVERGIAVAEEAADLFALRMFCAELLHDMGEAQRSMEFYDKALESACDEIQRCQASIGLAATKRMTDEFDAALEILAKAEQIAAQRNAAFELAKIHHLRGNLYFPLGNIDGCRIEHETALAYAEQAESAEYIARALGGLGDAYYASGRMITSQGYLNRCIDLCRKHGFGSVEAGYLHMRADTYCYQCELDRAFADYRRIAKTAAKIGNRRAEFFGLWGLFELTLDMGNESDTQLKTYVESMQTIATQLGLKRCEPLVGMIIALIAMREGNRSEVDEILQEAYRTSQETGVTFVGPWVLGVLAMATVDPALRAWSLQEAERVLAEQTCVSHNYMYFYRYAMDACLNCEDWDRVDGFARALEDYTRVEPLPWCDFFIARGRALAAIGRGRRDEATMAEVRRLRDEAERIGFRSALAALERALAAA